jgi:hypothetical protein
MAKNPYNWQSHTPKIQVPRPDIDLIAGKLLHNGSSVVLGGRGMGKSVFLGQLKERLEREEGTRVLLIEAPPAALTVEACLGYLAELLETEGSPYSSRLLFERYFERSDAPERLILLFDEFDRYAEKGATSAQPPGRGFFNDLEATRRSLPRLGILAVGSIGLFIFRDVLGSSFLSRALHSRLRPFERSEADVLLAPFAERGTPLSEDAQDALFLASGGIPSLLTYGLQELWKLERQATILDVTTLYKNFEAGHEDYLRDLLNPVMDSSFSEAPARVWKYIQGHAGRIPRSDLEQAIGKPSGVLKLNVTDVLRLLEAVGVVRLESSVHHDNPLAIYPIPSLLNLPWGSAVEGDLRMPG